MHVTGRLHVCQLGCRQIPRLVPVGSMPYIDKSLRQSWIRKQAYYSPPGSCMHACIPLGGVNVSSFIRASNQQKAYVYNCILDSTSQHMCWQTDSFCNMLLSLPSAHPVVLS